MNGRNHYSKNKSCSNLQMDPDRLEKSLPLSRSADKDCKLANKHKSQNIFNGGAIKCVSIDSSTPTEFNLGRKMLMGLFHNAIGIFTKSHSVIKLISQLFVGLDDFNTVAAKKIHWNTVFVF